METQLVELHEDLEAEKDARNKAEKQKRDLGEVSQLHSAELSYRCESQTQV